MPLFSSEANQPGDSTDRQGGYDIQHRVLFDENGGNTDENRNDRKRRVSLLCPKSIGVPKSERRGQCSQNVHGRGNICICVCCVNESRQPCQQVVPRKVFRPQLLTVREENTEQDRICVGDYEKEHHFPERGDVIPQEEQMRS